MWQKIFPTFSQSFRLLSQSPCVICDNTGQGVLCKTCRQTIKKPKYSCRVCGQLLIGQSTDNRCRECIKSPPAYESLHYIGTYDEVLSTLIIRAKVGKQLSAVIALQLLVDDFTDNHKQWGQTFADYHLLPMPIPRSRLMQRGFNLPLLLAKRLSVQLNLPIIPQHSITLPFFVDKQAKLNRQQRQKNEHIYRINHQLPKKMLMIDDVVTTGTTIGQLAKRLRREKVTKLSVWAVARGHHSNCR